MFATEILSYVPAQLSKGKIVRVYFYALHPQSNTMKRVVVKCNRIKQPSIREQYAKALVHEINIKLAKGWNPFIEQEVGKNYVCLDVACQKYLSEKKRELRPDAYRSYSSFVTTFLEWLEKNKPHSYYCISFSQDDAVDFMDYVYNDKQVGAATYNNYRRFCIGLWNHFLSKRYVNYIANACGNGGSKRHFDKINIIGGILNGDFLDGFGTTAEKSRHGCYDGCVFGHNFVSI